MPWPDPAAWSPIVWFLYGFGALYLVGFFAYFFRFERAEKTAHASDPASVAHFNRILRGFPNSFYAKMLGKRRLEVTSESPTPTTGNSL